MPIWKHLKCTSDLGGHFKELLKCSARKDPVMMKKVSGLRATNIFPSTSNCSVRNCADEKEVLNFFCFLNLETIRFLVVCLPSPPLHLINCVCVCKLLHTLRNQLASAMVQHFVFLLLRINMAAPPFLSQYF
uniref:Uncharacterized protein n=1 Tax=Micrurus spixii TaxID=129469 RepID=A0A2D4M1E6_9SAUR